jgi:hypothetical protein
MFHFFHFLSLLFPLLNLLCVFFLGWEFFLQCVAKIPMSKGNCIFTNCFFTMAWICLKMIWKFVWFGVIELFYNLIFYNAHALERKIFEYQYWGSTCGKLQFSFCVVLFCNVSNSSRNCKSAWRGKDIHFYNVVCLQCTYIVRNSF